MAKRVQSPSSIKLYQQCPRKYYYQYILKLQTLPNIHLVRGNIAHTVLEKFFDVDVSDYTMEDFKVKLSAVIQDLLMQVIERIKSDGKMILLNKTVQQLRGILSCKAVQLFISQSHIVLGKQPPLGTMMNGFAVNNHTIHIKNDALKQCILSFRSRHENAHRVVGDSFNFL